MMEERKLKLSHIKEYLLERKNKLEEALSVLNKERTIEDQGQDIGDQVVSSSIETLRISLQSNELAEYNRIIQALDMIEAGTYGICVDCGQNISEKRLKSCPNVTRCMSCQEVLEEGN